MTRDAGVAYQCRGDAVSRSLSISHCSLADPSFDEVHFGGFAAKYIRRRYFMDVHPPLAKLLVTLSAWLGQFDGQFDFKDIGK